MSKRGYPHTLKTAIWREFALWLVVMTVIIAFAYWAGSQV